MNLKNFPSGSQDSASLILIDVVVSSLPPPGQSLKYQPYPFITYIPTPFHHTWHRAMCCLSAFYYLLLALPKFFNLPSPQTRTFKVFSDNVTVVMHLFPILRNLAGQLGKYSFIFILHFSPFLSLLSFPSVLFLLGTWFSLRLAFFMSQTVSNVIIC